MSGHGVYLALVVVALFLAGVVVAQDATTTVEPTTQKITRIPTLEEVKNDEFYPVAWATIPYKPLVDNERLFRKYKQCILAKKPRGCPRDVLELKTVLPEVLENLCAKCLPVHVERIKEILGYVCKQRRADYDEVRKARDPDGSLQKKFEDKFGTIEC